MNIHCCGCAKPVEARLTDGSEVYPHRKDLHNLPFWKCDQCNNYVGCHHKTKNRTQPLGVIPTPELRTLRNKIHQKIDVLWREGSIPRKKVYAAMSEAIGKSFHSATLSSVKDAEKVLEIATKPFNEWLSNNALKEIQ